jgi:uncharacterized hydrophobic protein (TIGR00271 family)
MATMPSTHKPDNPEHAGPPGGPADGPDEPNPIEEAARERLGVERWDRPLIFREAADAAVDNSLPYWLVLALSGAIATLGLALDSSAVVIGAMLVAPLLGPIVGLSLALAVGDSRLALQCLAVVGGSIVVVIATAAGVTAILPVHTITLEISSRIRPTTLDLGVAVFSGLVGALVTLARGKRLSAAIPGVAVAVALIPPMAVAGFGMAAGWHGEVVWGALLLLGANLAGIVLSGVVLFLLVGMHRAEVVAAARAWHEESRPNGVARLVCRLPGVGRAGVFGSALGRAGLVLGFVVLLAIPLSAAFREVIRETRVQSAVDAATALLEAGGATFIVSRQIELGPDSAIARIRVATGEGVSAGARDAFRRRATELAGEPVALRLEQVPSSADASALQALLRGGADRRRGDDDPAWPETVARAREALERAAWSLPFPDGARAIGVTLRVEGGRASSTADSAEVRYLAPAPLEPQAADVLGRSLRRAVGHPELRTAFLHAGPAATVLPAGDTAGIGAVVALLLRYPELRLTVRSAAADSAARDATIRILRAAGVEAVAEAAGAGAGAGAGAEVGAGARAGGGMAGGVVELRVWREGEGEG